MHSIFTQKRTLTCKKNNKKTKTQQEYVEINIYLL